MRRRRRGGMRPGADLLRRWRSGPSGSTRGVPVALEEVWAEVAGAEVARVSRPIGLNDRGVLTIAVADAIWSQEITARADELVAALAETRAAADVRRLRTRVADQVFSVGADEPSRPSVTPPDAAAQEAAREAARAISDPEVRAAVERAAAAALSHRNKSG